MKMFLAFCLLLSLASTSAAAQALANQPITTHTEVAAEYSYAHANAPPENCGCFSVNGGSLSIAQPSRSGHLAPAFDARVAHGTAGQYGLTLSTFTAGARYRTMPGAR